MKRLNIVFGLVLIAVSAVFFFYADTFRKLAGQKDMGPAAFPKAVCVMLAISGIILIVSELKKGSEETVELVNKKLLIGAVTAIVYYLLLRPVGFLIPSMAAVFIMEVLLLNEPFKKALPLMLSVAVIAPLAIQFIFGNLLKVPLPAGILSGLF